MILYISEHSLHLFDIFNVANTWKCLAIVSEPYLGQHPHRPAGSALTNSFRCDQVSDNGHSWRKKSVKSKSCNIELIYVVTKIRSTVAS